MTLSDVEIWAELGSGRLIIDPLPEADRVTGSSIDLLLYKELLVLPTQSEVKGVTIDPSETNVMSMLRKFGKPHDLSAEGLFKMLPGRMVIGRTHEHIEIPPHLAARIEGKSTLARLGLAVHITAPTVQAGFQGRLYLEMYNAGPFALELGSQMKIAQLIVEHLGLPAKEPYRGKYLGQS
ncbi:MAG: dCTP deaminase [Chloroflexi bacterium]|nr:dCTP deaminase [Chloroflexota bacterium]